MTNARTTDPKTSKAAALKLSPWSMCRDLLEAFASTNTRGLTDEEAGTAAHLGYTGYWKRCSDLRNKGFIQWKTDKYGDMVTRIAPLTGRYQGVSVITPAGRAALKGVARAA